MIEFFPSREIILVLGGWSIHWYGALYVASFGLAIWLLPQLQKWREITLSRQDWVELVSWVAVGVLVGGRLGYVLLYEPTIFLYEPGKVFAIWNGGMASHGGFVGVAIVVWFYVRYALPKALPLGEENRWRVYLRMLDVLVVPIALGLSLGRVGNVINQELFETSLVQFLAIAKNIFIAGICFWYLRSNRSLVGGTTAMFLVSYGLLRFIIEFIRVQDHSLVWGLSLGQIYTMPVIVIGVVLGIYVNIGRHQITNEDKN